MPSLRQRFSVHPHRGFEVSTVNSGQLTAQEQVLLQAGIPLHIVMEGTVAVHAYASEANIELPKEYEVASSTQHTQGMSNPFSNSAYNPESSIYSSDDFLG